MPSSEDFHAELVARLDRAARQGRPHAEINAGELHRSLGGYPGVDHAMPSCCNVMRREFDLARDELIYEPVGGQGASLTIRYALPR